MKAEKFKALSAGLILMSVLGYSGIAFSSNPNPCTVGEAYVPAADPGAIDAANKIGGDSANNFLVTAKVGCKIAKSKEGSNYNCKSEITRKQSDVVRKLCSSGFSGGVPMNVTCQTGSWQDEGDSLVCKPSPASK